MNEIKPKHPLLSRHRPVLDAFNAVADRFDESYENAITRAIRDRLYDEISHLITAGSRVLDINCGTGIDALHLARRGYKVTGCDLSPNMILRAREKAAAAGLPDVKFHVVSFEELDRVLSTPFDLVLSNFGGLNCVADLRPAVRQVASLLKPCGAFLAVVMPPLSPWDVIASFSRGRFRPAFFRLGDNVQATGFPGKPFTVYYHSLKTLRRSCHEYFFFSHARGLNIITPPPHATSFSGRFPRLRSVLESIERPLASLPIIRSFGDHYVAAFRRRESLIFHGPSS